MLENNYPVEAATACGSLRFMMVGTHGHELID